MARFAKSLEDRRRVREWQAAHVASVSCSPALCARVIAEAARRGVSVRALADQLIERGLVEAGVPPLDRPAAPARLADVAWRDRYEIASRTGLLYGRRRVLDTANLMWRGIVERRELAAVLDDEAFMRPRRGTLLRAVARDAGLEAIARRGRA